MMKANETIDRDDPFHLRRFTSAQDTIYEGALAELRSGQKRTHWMWYIFPQLDCLGYSPTSKRYAITSLEEAQQYLKHPVLGPRLLECSATVLAIEGRSIAAIFGYPDHLKLQSSMTLFACVAEPDSVFVRVLEKYFHGERDAQTLHLLEKLRGKQA